MAWIRRLHRGLCPIFLLCTVFLLVGTSNSAAQEKEAARGMTREELRHAIMRFSGSSSDRIGETYVQLEERFRTPEGRLAAVENSSAYVSSALDIAIGPDPEANLLDMVVLVTLARMVVEEYWVPQVFGDEAKILVEVFRRQEAEIWAIAAKVLTPQQQRELRDSIRQWRARNPDQIFVEATRFGDFAAILGESELAKAQAGGGFLGVKGVTREVSETRLLAERAMFYAQRVPWILRLSARLMLLDVVQTPEVNQLVTNSTTFAESAKELVQFAKGLPKYVSEEREAMFDQMMSQEKPVRDLLGDVQQTLTAGTALASQLDTTVHTVDGLMARLHARRKEPIDVKDIQKILAQTSEIIQQLTTLLAATEQTLTSGAPEKTVLARIGVTVDRVGQEGQEFVDYAFGRAVVLIVIFLIGAVVAGLVYRYASVRLIGSGQASGG